MAGKKYRFVIFRGLNSKHKDKKKGKIEWYWKRKKGGIKDRTKEIMRQVLEKKEKKQHRCVLHI